MNSNIEAKKTVVFITAGGDDIGGGHVMRALTLADGLSNKGWTCSFSAANGDGDFHKTVIQNRYPYIALDEAQASLAVVDDYELGQVFETSIRSRFEKIMVIDDLANRDHDCDLLLDQNYKRRVDDYQNLVPEQATILAGSGYALLRPAFREHRGQILPRVFPEDRPLKILVSFGMVDNANMTEAILKALLENINLEQFDITAVLGGVAVHGDRIKKALEKYDPCPVTVLENVDDMAELMADNDLVIGAFGTTSWERCCLGLPSVSLVVAENQQHICDALVDKGAAVCPGTWPNIDAMAVVDAMLDVIADPKAYLRMSKVASTSCDGKGVGRVVLAVENIFVSAP